MTGCARPAAPARSTRDRRPQPGRAPGTARPARAGPPRPGCTRPGGGAPTHTPAALAGRPEPGAGRYCPPALCWCGHCPAPGPEGQEQEKAPSGLTFEAAALRYMGRGWPVFVLGRSKRPVANCPACRAAGPGHDPAGCGCLTCHGFHAATLDPARLAAMLAAVPGGLLAIRTGTAAGLAVVDIDPRNGGPGRPGADDAHRGGGHRRGRLAPVLPAPRRPAAGRPARPGRGRRQGRRRVRGRPALGPPRHRPGVPVGGGAARSRDAPRAAPRPWPRRRRGAPAPLSGPRRTRGAGGISSPPALLAAHLRAVETAPEGRRRVTLYGAARGIARMVTAGAITEHDARAALTAAGLAAAQTERDIRAAIDGAFRDEGAAA